MFKKYYFARYTAKGKAGCRMVSVWFWETPELAINLILDGLEGRDGFENVSLESFNRVT